MGAPGLRLVTRPRGFLQRALSCKGRFPAKSCLRLLLGSISPGRIKCAPCREWKQPLDRVQLSVVCFIFTVFDKGQGLGRKSK